jgi:tetratricopeptide (TPR) repeat protein
VSPSGAKHENWVEVRSENFIIVSNAGEKEARQTAVHMEQVRALFRRSLAVASQHKSPVITMLAVKNEDSMKELLPDYWAKGHVHLAGIFLYRWDVYFAAANLAAGGANPLKTIYHEYYHSLTMPYFPNLPLWLAEGLADFFGNTEIKEKEVIIGKGNPNLIWELRTNQIIPLDVLFKVDHSSPYYNEEKKRGVFYAESWALTHYLMVGDRMAHRPMFLNYLNALNQGKSASEAAAIAFGDLGKLQSQLVNYINNSHYLEFKGEAPPPPAEVSVKARPISDAEADAYRGGFEVIRGKPDEADPILAEAVQLDPKVALAHQYLALAQLTTGQRAEALASVGKVIELDPANGLTRFLRAQMLFSESRGREKILKSKKTFSQQSRRTRISSRLITWFPCTLSIGEKSCRRLLGLHKKRFSSSQETRRANSRLREHSSPSTGTTRRKLPEATLAPMRAIHTKRPRRINSSRIFNRCGIPPAHPLPQGRRGRNRSWSFPHKV